jgi:hypothetical protein
LYRNKEEKKLKLKSRNRKCLHIYHYWIDDFKGEVISSYKKRPEGVRVKHQVNANSVKMYDKKGSGLRVEATINNVRDFKVYKEKRGEFCINGFRIRDLLKILNPGIFSGPKEKSSFQNYSKNSYAACSWDSKKSF